MSVTFVNMRLLALSAGLALTAVAGFAPIAMTETVEEDPAVAQNPTDQPAVSAPYLLTPEMSDQLAFEQAVAAGSSAALIMFLARNPDTAQATEVRQLLTARRTPDDLVVIEAVAGGDAEVVSAFDTARLSGTRAGWDAFMKRHAGHPLSAQVQYFMP